MRKKSFTILMIGILCVLTLGACGAQADTTAGSTRHTLQISN